MTMPPGVIVAAPASGSGKTTVTLGLLRALARRHGAVQPYKCGPDYIDTAFHAMAARRPSYNLDTWAMSEAALAAVIAEGGAGARLAVAEGVMGLFDGVDAPGASGRGATADLAAVTGWPVLLVLDVSAQGETAAAVALGCARYRPDVAIAGVVLNRVGGEAHARLIAPHLEALAIPCFGAVPHAADLVLPERHLGLVQAGETADLDARLDRIADIVAAAVDLDAVVGAARATAVPRASFKHVALPPPGQRVALAADAAFAFAYAHVVAGWRRAGAEIHPFSPLADEAPDPTADAVWLPGGYPELHAGTLAAAHRFRDGLVALAAQGVPIHGECGGYMVLGAGLEDASGARHAMTGLLGVETSFAAPRMHLGYRRARLVAPSALGPPGAEVLGHEFHFAAVTATPEAPLMTAEDAHGRTVEERGARRGSVTGTFFHAIERVAS